MSALEKSISDLGLSAPATIAELTALFRALGKPSTRDLALRHLELEWLGAAEQPRSYSAHPTRADLMHVLARAVGIDAVEAFSLSDVERGMAYPASQIRGFVRDCHLWAYGQDSLQFPRWQFAIGRDGLPIGFISDRLQIVVAAIPESANPGLVRSLMTLSSPFLPHIRGRELSPREYLLSGGAPSAVSALLLRYLGADEEHLADVASRVVQWA